MSKEQANTFKRFRDADDAMGNLGWATKMSKRTVKQAVEASDETERLFGFNNAEKVLWRLMRLPRRYSDVETCKVLAPEKIRAILRGLVAADVLDIGDEEPRQLVPLEIKRVIRQVKGQGKAEPVRAKPIAERVYRPNIEGPPDTDVDAAASFADAPQTLAEGPKTPVSTREAASADASPNAAPAALDAKDWATKKKIIAAFQKASRTKSHYEFLGVSVQANDESIQTAYLAMARDFHPDIVSGTVLESDEEARSMLNAVFKRVQDAKSTLGKADSRARYDRQFAAGEVREVGTKVKRRPQEALVLYQKGETFFRRKDYANAEVQLRAAMSLDDQEPKILSKLAWVMWLNPARPEAERMNEATTRLAEIVTTYRFADAAYKLGLLARIRGDEKAALKHINEALRLDPNHPDAKQERRLADMRKNKVADEGKGVSGLLSRFKK